MTAAVVGAAVGVAGAGVGAGGVATVVTGAGSAAVGSVPAGGSQAGAGGEGAGRVSNVQRIQQKKAQVRAWPRDKKLEKLAIYSSCRVSTLFGFLYCKVSEILQEKYPKDCNFQQSFMIGKLT